MTVNLAKVRGNSIKILALLKDEQQGLLSTRIFEKLKLDATINRVYLYNLQKYGLLQREHFGYWTLTPMRRNFIRSSRGTIRNEEMP